MNKALAIMWLFPQAQPPFDFCVGQDDTGQFITHWGIDAPEPTEEELQIAWEAYSANEAATAYKVKRAAEYPPIGDQLDTIFHQGVDAWKAQIQAVKDKYPKSEALPLVVESAKIATT